MRILVSERRRALTLAALALPLLPLRARAGAQQYEALAASVRTALSALIADPTPPTRRFDTPAERAAFERWRQVMSRRLAARLALPRTRDDLLRTLDYEAIRAGLDRQMVLGLIQVESNFRKYAISGAGAMGYMQVMPFWVDLIGDGNVRSLFDMRTNLRYGCVILRHYIDEERGDLFRALGRYNGSVGDPVYPNAVLAAWKGNWSYRGG